MRQDQKEQRFGGDGFLGCKAVHQTEAAAPRGPHQSGLNVIGISVAPVPHRAGNQRGQIADKNQQ